MLIRKIINWEKVRKQLNKHAKKVYGDKTPEYNAYMIGAADMIDAIKVGDRRPLLDIKPYNARRIRSGRKTKSQK